MKALTFGFLLLTLLLSACTSEHRPMLNRGIVQNATADKLTEVRVLHHPTGATAGFSAILPGLDAELGFSPTEMRADQGEISWIERGRGYRVKLGLPKLERADDRPRTLVYRIEPGGRATVSLQAGGPLR